MNSLGRVLLFFIFFASLAFLHAAIRIQGFSLFLFPIAITAIAPYLEIRSIAGIVGGLLALEIFSSLPPGTMVFIACISFFIRHITSRVEIGHTLAFFGVVLATVTIQFLIIVAAATLTAIPFREISTTDIPFRPLVLSWVATSALVYACSIIWHEFIPSRDRQQPTLKNWRATY